MRRSEALKLIGRLEARRDAALEDGDFDTATAASAKISELEDAVEAAGRPGPKEEKKGPGCLKVGAAVLGLLFVVSLFDSDPEPARPATPEQAADQAAEAADRERDRNRPTPSRLRIAAKYAIEDVARDPESVEVESCALVQGANPDELPVPYVCVYRARNGFGGMNRSQAQLMYFGVGNAVVTSTE